MLQTYERYSRCKCKASGSVAEASTAVVASTKRKATGDGKPAGAKRGRKHKLEALDAVNDEEDGTKGEDESTIKGEEGNDGGKQSGANSQDN